MVRSVPIALISLLLACGGLTPEIPEPDRALREAEEARIQEQEQVAPSGPITFELEAYPAPELPWEAETIWGCCGVPLQALTASSTLPPQGRNAYGVEHLGDDDPKTAWVEGAEGHGEGERLAFEWYQEGDMDCGVLQIRNGYQKSKKLFQANGRVKELKVHLDGELVGTVTLKDSYHDQLFRPGAKPGQRVELEIASVYPGAKHQDTALSQLVQICAP
ncbi:MAG: hypothetical protein EA397_02375 [Deltaproteobacteria bacterium]|nr:MAG: hypothetical protein EA397_02375 [Deltaproteobacteria bacterium]